MLYLHARMFKYEIIILFYEFKFRMAKITISELEIVRSSMPTPISVSVMAKVNKNLPRWKVQISNWEGADMINFSLVATCTDTSKNGMINEEKLLTPEREFILKNGKVAKVRKIKVLAKANIDIPVEILDNAEQLLSSQT